MSETGRIDFKRVGGRLCLDFVNTTGGWSSQPGPRRARDWRDRPEREWLTSYEALLEWAVSNDVVTRAEARRLSDAAAERPSRASAVLARALKLRQAAYRLMRASLEGWKPDAADVALLDDELRAARSHQRLGAALPLTVSWEADEKALDRMLWPVAVDAADLLGGTDLDRLGQCPGEECGWMFYDGSRSRRRKWCDMGDCGNVAKVRRFREKEARVRA